MSDGVKLLLAEWGRTYRADGSRALGYPSQTPDSRLWMTAPAGINYFITDDDIQNTEKALIKVREFHHNDYQYLLAAYVYQLNYSQMAKQFGTSPSWASKNKASAEITFLKELDSL